MKAQISLEFMFVFCLELIVLSTIGASLLAQHEQAQGKADDMGEVLKAESAARAVEAWLGTGMDMRFGFDDVSYRVENGTFRMWHGGDIIEIEGVFDGDTTEPL